MQSHPEQPMVQLSALLCLVPLALEDSDLQASWCLWAASACAMSVLVLLFLQAFRVAAALPLICSTSMGIGTPAPA